MPINGINLIYGLRFDTEVLARLIDLDYDSNILKTQLADQISNNLSRIKDNIYVYKLPCCFFHTSKLNSEIYFGIELDSIRFKYDYTCPTSGKKCKYDPRLIFTFDNKEDIVKTFETLEDYKKYYSVEISYSKEEISNLMNYYLKSLDEIFDDENQIIAEFQPKFYALPNGCTDC